MIVHDQFGISRVDNTNRKEINSFFTNQICGRNSLGNCFVFNWKCCEQQDTNSTSVRAIVSGRVSIQSRGFYIEVTNPHNAGGTNLSRRIGASSTPTNEFFHPQLTSRSVGRRRKDERDN